MCSALQLLPLLHACHKCLAFSTGCYRRLSLHHMTQPGLPNQQCKTRNRNKAGLSQCYIFTTGSPNNPAPQNIRRHSTESETLSHNSCSDRSTALAAAAVKGQNGTVQVWAPVSEEAPAAEQCHTCVRGGCVISCTSLWRMQNAGQNLMFME